MLKHSICTIRRGLRGRPNARSVSSLGPLGSAFNAKPSLSRQLPWSRPATGLFNVPELTSGEGFYTIKERCVENSGKLVEEACSPLRSELSWSLFSVKNNEQNSTSFISTTAKSK
jgi:hypothetical protein